MMFTRVSDAINWIESRPRFRTKTSLNPVLSGFRLLDIDLDCKKVHIAGTNGKGSTAAFISYMAYENNLRVGTFTSPYLIKFNERIRINTKEISDDELLEYINYIHQIGLVYQETYDDSLSFFELLTLMAFKYFHDMKVDLMVIEAGIGGLFDATNILNYDVSIITNVGFDHVKQLGDSLESIALNKLGIVKESGYLLTTVRPELVSLANQYCLDVGAVMKHISNSEVTTVVRIPHVISYQDSLYQINLIGDYQNYNAALAIEAIKHLYPTISDYTIKQGLIKCHWAGRMEEVVANVYIDGAHNEHAINGLISIINNEFKGNDVYIIFSCLKDKEPNTLLTMLKPYVKKIVLTSFTDVRFESLEPLSDSKMPYIPDFNEALNYVRKISKKDDVIIVTGSIHFIGAVRNLIKHEE